VQVGQGADALGEHRGVDRHELCLCFRSHDPGAVATLLARGHLVELADSWWLGRTCAAGIDPASGFLHAAANPRGCQPYAAER
jgi:hypothetical protein